MTQEAKFRQVADSLLSLFGQVGTLYSPTTYDYDTSTGDTTDNADFCEVKYIVEPYESLSYQDRGLAKFNQSKVSFYVTNLVQDINETSYIVGIDGIKWEFTRINKIYINNNIVAYEAYGEATR